MAQESPRRLVKRNLQDRDIDAVVAGYLGVDLTPGFPDHRPAARGGIFRPGALIETRGLTMSLGGAVANTGLAMRKFGMKVVLQGTAGADDLGRFVVAEITKRTGGRGLRIKPNHRTAYGLVIAVPGMDRIFFEEPGCNETFSAADIDFGLVGRSRLFHLGYPPLMKALWVNEGRECIKIFKRVKQGGTLTSLDMALCDPTSAAGNADWKAILQSLLPAVDIFLPSIEELFSMLRPCEYSRVIQEGGSIDTLPESAFQDLAREVMGFGTRILLIKAGRRGAFLCTGELRELSLKPGPRFSLSKDSHVAGWIHPFPVVSRRVKNASGAGDCAAAGFLTALLEGCGVVDAARLGMVAGRDNLYGIDALSGLQSWRAMISFVRKASARGFTRSAP